MLRVAVARSSSDNNEICHLLSVLPFHSLSQLNEIFRLQSAITFCQLTQHVAVVDGLHVRLVFR